jgi:hypothetical protein
MPRAPIRIRLIRRVGERSMDALAIGHRCAPIDRGANERMAEYDSVT